MTDRNDKSRDEAFAESAKAHFDNSVASLDGQTRSKLTSARHRALEELRPGGRPAWLEWAPAGGVAAAAVVALIMWTGVDQAVDQAEPDMATDMEILLTEDSLEMLQDLEFYSWIDLEDEANATPQTENHVG